MTEMILLSEAQMARISPFFPLSHGIPRVDDRRVISGIIFVIRNGLRWRDVPPSYGPHKTIYNRFIRWSELGVFGRIFVELARDDDRRNPPQGAPDSGQPAQKGALPRHIGRTKGGLNSKLHAVCDSQGRPRTLFLSAGQVSDYTGAAALLGTMPAAKVLLADKGYDADWLRDALADRKIEACIPSKSNRKIQIPHDRVLYRKRHKIENMFGKLKDWRRIHTRYDRCAHTFMSAIAIAAIVIFWI
jgi:transposase